MAVSVGVGVGWRASRREVVKVGTLQPLAKKVFFPLAGPKREVACVTARGENATDCFLFRAAKRPKGNVWAHGAQ